MTYEDIPINQISDSAPAANRLSTAQKTRIRQIAAAVAEVYPMSEQEWLDGFAADRRPEPEIVVWEVMALAYSSFVEQRNLGLAARHEVLNLALSRSMGRTSQTIMEKPLAELSADERQEFLRIFSSAAATLGMLEQPG